LGKGKKLEERQGGSVGMGGDDDTIIFKGKESVGRNQGGLSMLIGKPRLAALLEEKENQKGPGGKSQKKKRKSGKWKVPQRRLLWDSKVRGGENNGEEVL